MPAFEPVAPMFPKSLALIEDDDEYARDLSRYLTTQGGAMVHRYPNGNDLLASAEPFGYEFYVLDLLLPGVDGLDLIDVLRRRTQVGILVVSGRLGSDTFKRVITAGADMYLAKPVQLEQVALAITAVQRRVLAAGPAAGVWRLERRSSHLVAPDGKRVALSETDLALMECFASAGGEVVRRETLLERLGRSGDPDGSTGLNATIFRLRRRIERSTPLAVPLQTKSGVGYVFRAPLQLE